MFALVKNIDVDVGLCVWKSVKNVLEDCLGQMMLDFLCERVCKMCYRIVLAKNIDVDVGLCVWKGVKNLLEDCPDSKYQRQRCSPVKNINIGDVFLG